MIENNLTKTKVLEQKGDNRSFSDLRFISF